MMDTVPVIHPQKTDLLGVERKQHRLPSRSAQSAGETPQEPAGCVGLVPCAGSKVTGDPEPCSSPAQCFKGEDRQASAVGKVALYFKMKCGRGRLGMMNWEVQMKLHSGGISVFPWEPPGH